MRNFGNIFVAELRKTATLPAAWAGLAVALCGSALITTLNALMVKKAVLEGTTQQLANTSPFEAGFVAMPIIGVLGAVVVGVIAISSEYSSDRAEADGVRQITTTLVAIPHRGTLFVAKIIVVLAFVALTALVTIPANLALARGIIGEHGTEIVSGEEALTRSLGAALYWVLMGLMAMAITTLTRSGLIPLIVLIANSSVVSFSLLLSNLTPAAQWLPDLAGRKLFGFSGEYVLEGGLETVPGALVMAAWALVLLLIAGVVFRRRDA